jgi:4-amino-4-deoxy-L-arabinose transferase-like glycosyltransferase
VKKSFLKFIKNEFFLVPLLLAILAFLSISSFKNESVTSDEWKYLQAGREIWQNSNWYKDLANAYGPPFTFYHAPLTYYIQGAATSLFHPKDDKTLLFYARLLMQPVLILFALSLYIVVRHKYNKKAATFALILFTFNTEILTHGRLAGIDLTLAFTIFLALTTFYYFLTKQNIKSILLAGFCLGLAFLAKYNALILLPFLAATVVCYMLFSERKINLILLVKSIALILFAIFILNLGYGFKGSLQIPPSFKSRVFTQVSQNTIGGIIMRAFPQPFLVGADYQYDISQSGWKYYLLGKTSYGWDFRYFSIAFSIKTAIPFLILIALTLYFTKKKFFEWYLIASVIYFFGYMSLFNKIDIGLRYILMIYPLLIVLISAFIPKIDKNKKLLLPVLILIVWQIWETLSIYPHYFVYFNQFIGGPKNGYKYLTDSNIDFDQDDDYAKNYFKLHPEIIINPDNPVKGKVAVKVNFLNLSHDQNYWLRKLNKKPVGYINYSWIIFDITANDLQKI